MAQQGYLQTHWQKSMEAFHPGMIASQMPKSIKTGLFMPTDRNATLQFGVACGRAGADGMSVKTPDNFGEGNYPTGTRTDPLPRYASGGGAFVTNTLGYESIPTGCTVQTNHNATAPAVAVTGTDDAVQAFYEDILINDYIQILDTSSNDAQLEIVRVKQVGAPTGSSGSRVISLVVSRGAFGSTAAAAVAGDKIRIFGRTNTYAGVVIKDLTLEGRYEATKFDQFVYGDEIAVGLRGDYAVRVNDNTSAGGNGTGARSISADDRVSVFVGSATARSDNSLMDGKLNSDTGWWYGYFSNHAPDHNHILIPGARFVTEASDCNMYIRNSDTGWQPGHEVNQTRRVAAVRFDSFA